jgi:hypothetical protein
MKTAITVSPEGFTIDGTNIDWRNFHRFIPTDNPNVVKCSVYNDIDSPVPAGKKEFIIKADTEEEFEEIVDTIRSSGRFF